MDLGLIIAAVVIVVAIAGVVVAHRKWPAKTDQVGAQAQAAVHNAVGELTSLLHKSEDTKQVMAQTNQAQAAVIAAPAVQSVVNAGQAAPPPAPTLSPLPLDPALVAGFGGAVGPALKPPRDQHYLYPGDAGYPTGGWEASVGSPVRNPANPPTGSTPGTITYTVTKADKVNAALFKATAGASGMGGSDATVVNTVMSGFNEFDVPAQHAIGAGQAIEDVRAALLNG
jgi:hypothetical protein